MLKITQKRVSIYEMILQAIEEAEQEAEKRRHPDISIRVAASKISDHHYSIDISNIGNLTYNNLRILYEPVLLDAGSFGLDTTHMPSNHSRIAGEPIIVDTLQPGQSAHFIRNGYGSHTKYDNLAECPFNLEYQMGSKSYVANDRHWTIAIVDLPNASRG